MAHGSGRLAQKYVLSRAYAGVCARDFHSHDSGVMLPAHLAWDECTLLGDISQEEDAGDSEHDDRDDPPEVRTSVPGQPRMEPPVAAPGQETARRGLRDAGIWR